jgi:adenine-specific DNA-methyltransferase
VAAIDDLIAQIEDKALRERLRLEMGRITKEKKFGLVFEDHLPELTPVYSARVRKGCNVALRDGALSALWRVLSVQGESAECVNRSTGEKRMIPLVDLVVVRQFGEPIFPALVPVERVQNGAEDAPWHTLIEADNYHALQLLEYLYAGQVDCIYIDPPYNSGAKDWKYNNNYVDKNDQWRHSKWLAFIRRRLILTARLLNPKTGVLIVTIDEHEVHHLGIGLAKFAEKHWTLFDRIQLVRKQKAADGKEHYFRLNIGDDVVRKKVLGVTDNSHLDQLFAAEAKP